MNNSLITLLNIENVLNMQNAAQSFVGVDKSNAPFCALDLKDECQLGDKCPNRHKQKNSVVCKHWLKGACKNGDKCDFLHIYDRERMPECHFYSNFGKCANKECIYLHKGQKLVPCPWYARGFCRHGADCKKEHVRKIHCPKYAVGFCMDGPHCQFFHPTFELPINDPVAQSLIRCHSCGEMGHKSTVCPSLKKEEVAAFLAITNPMMNQMVNPMMNPNNGQQFRPIEQVTCYKCGQKGHYANKCTMKRIPIV